MTASTTCLKARMGRWALAAAFYLALWQLAAILVGQPLLDVPYLFDPVRVELHDVETRDVSGESGATYYLSGVDEAGKEWEFRINSDTFLSWDRGRTTATVTGLPNTQVTLAIE